MGQWSVKAVLAHPSTGSQWSVRAAFADTSAEAQLVDGGVEAE